MCTGVMLLASAGLTRGRPAVTHHGAMEELKATGAEVVSARVVDNGDIITAGGITSGLDLALWLVERFADPQVAHKVEIALEYERRGIVWRSSISVTYSKSQGNWREISLLGSSVPSDSGSQAHFLSRPPLVSKKLTPANVIKFRWRQ